MVQTVPAWGVEVVLLDGTANLYGPCRDRREARELSRHVSTSRRKLSSRITRISHDYGGGRPRLLRTRPPLPPELGPLPPDPLSVIKTNVDLLMTNFDDEVVFVNSLLNEVTITLPATHPAGQRKWIKDWGLQGQGSNKVNTIYVNPNGAKIDGESGVFIFPPYNGFCLRLVSDGTNWIIGV